MNVKELLTNEELMNNIVEDIDDIPEDTKIDYEVWLFRYNKNGTVSEFLKGIFDNPDEAVKRAKAFELIEPEGLTDEERIFNRMTIEVETVIEDPDDEDGGTMNIGTIYSRELWTDGEYGDEEDLPEIEEPFVGILSSDCTILDDGTLKIRRDLLKDYNKNDLVNLYFIDEPDTSILTYKIISKVEYVDGDYYHCDLLI
jgi:hypothetical protein